MKTLKNYIVEQKNTHMTHVEDLVFDGGVGAVGSTVCATADVP